MLCVSDTEQTELRSAAGGLWGKPCPEATGTAVWATTPDSHHLRQGRTHPSLPLTPGLAALNAVRAHDTGVEGGHVSHLDAFRAAAMPTWVLHAGRCPPNSAASFPALSPVASRTSSREQTELCCPSDNSLFSVNAATSSFTLAELRTPDLSNDSANGGTSRPGQDSPPQPQAPQGRGACGPLAPGGVRGHPAPNHHAVSDVDLQNLLQ